MIKNIIRGTVTATLFALVSTFTVYAQVNRYPKLSKSVVVLRGQTGRWDSSKVHTLSVVVANRSGYKYWGYYGLAYYGGNPNLRKAGLVRSNDLIHWVRYKGNPIIKSDCRWPTVMVVGLKTYMFYAEYDSANDSRIVMVSSRDGVHFGHKKAVVPMKRGEQNQNPFIFFNKRDNHFYLLYYSGVERSKDSTKNHWGIVVRRSRQIDRLGNATPKTLLTFSHTTAAPSIAYFKGRYYLLVEAKKAGEWNNKWVTLAYAGDKIEGPYNELGNNPVLSNNDACAFEYVLNGHLYIFYSHCVNLAEWNWELKMVKAEK